MGLSATNARFLAFTSRKHDITGMQMHYSNQKMALSHDMQRVSRNYQNALNSKIYKWSNNGGVSYSTLSYNNLMRPSTMNQNKAYLLTDLAGRVVIDSKYKEYAEMITANGGYDNCRNELLSKATGISASTIAQIHLYHEAIYQAKTELDSFRPEPNPKDKSKYPGLMQVGIKGLLEKLGSNTGKADTTAFDCNGNTWLSSYNDEKGSIFLANDQDNSANNYTEYCASDMEKIAGYICDVFSEYLIDDSQKSKLKDALDKYILGLINGELVSDAKGDRNGILEHTEDGYRHIKTHEFIEGILGAYFNNGGESKTTSGYGGGNQEIIWYDTTSDAYKNYVVDKEQWEADYNALTEKYNELNSKSGQLLTSEQEQLINFYDEIFSSIAEKGWVYNNCVTDDEYLNQMLQNNMYTITEINRRHICDGEEKEHYYVNDYIEDVAGNMPKLYQVADEEAILEAQVEYENEKAIINEKETRIDLRMDTLKTELDAINTMMKSMEKIKKENIDRTMNITG